MKAGTEAGADVLDRITQIAGARPWLLGVSPPPGKDATSDPKTIIAAAKALAERAHARAKAAAA